MNLDIVTFVLISLFLWGIMELTIFQFCGLPTKLSDLVAYCHCDLGWKWILPTYFFVMFIVTGIDQLTNGIAMIGWLSIGVGVLFPCVALIERCTKGELAPT